MFIGTLPSVCDTQAEAAEHKKTWTGLAAQSHLGSGSVWHSMTAPDVVKDTAKRLKIMRVDRVRQSDVRANLIEQVWTELILPQVGLQLHAILFAEPRRLLSMLPAGRMVP